MREAPNYAVESDDRQQRCQQPEESGQHGHNPLSDEIVGDLLLKIGELRDDAGVLCGERAFEIRPQFNFVSSVPAKFSEGPPIRIALKRLSRD
jgi:hypothetical protein